MRSAGENQVVEQRSESITHGKVKHVDDTDVTEIVTGMRAEMASLKIELAALRRIVDRLPPEYQKGVQLRGMESYQS